jgi:hypothetical protein
MPIALKERSIFQSSRTLPSFPPLLSSLPAVEAVVVVP